MVVLLVSPVSVGLVERPRLASLAVEVKNELASELLSDDPAASRCCTSEP